MIEEIVQNKNNMTVHGMAVLTICCLVAAYYPTLIWMWDRWFIRDSYYSHGILIPFVSLFLIWQLMDELKEIECKGSGWGIVLIVIGFAIHVFSALFRIYFSSGFSMLIVLFGIVLYFYGGKILNKIFFPLAFLVFMIPLPLVLIEGISFKLKMLAAHIATLLLNKMRIPAIREGSVIKMRNAFVVVDDVCSGLRSLISLMALGSIFAFWMKSSVTKKVLLFLTTIPIAIITNVCRIIFLASVSEIWGPEYATGFVHDLSGFLVFALAFILLFASSKLI